MGMILLISKSFWKKKSALDAIYGVLIFGILILAGGI
jgi:hypothetical protein